MTFTFRPSIAKAFRPRSSRDPPIQQFADRRVSTRYSPTCGTPLAESRTQPPDRVDLATICLPLAFAGSPLGIQHFSVFEPAEFGKTGSSRPCRRSRAICKSSRSASVGVKISTGCARRWHSCQAPAKAFQSPGITIRKYSGSPSSVRVTPRAARHQRSRHLRADRLGPDSETHSCRSQFCGGNRSGRTVKDSSAEEPACTADTIPARNRG